MVTEARQLRFEDIPANNLATRPAIPKIELPFSKGKMIYDEIAVTDFFYKLIPHLYRIDAEKRISIPFQNGWFGEVELRTPAYVVFTDRVLEDGRECNLEVPTLVKHLRHGQLWTVGFRTTIDPNTEKKIKKFAYPRAAYKGLSGLREATGGDVAEFKRIWENRTAKNNG